MEPAVVPFSKTSCQNGIEVCHLLGCFAQWPVLTKQIMHSVSFFSSVLYVLSLQRVNELEWMVFWGGFTSAGLKLVDPSRVIADIFCRGEGYRRRPWKKDEEANLISLTNASKQ